MQSAIIRLVSEATSALSGNLFVHSGRDAAEESIAEVQRPFQIKSTLIATNVRTVRSPWRKLYKVKYYN